MNVFTQLGSAFFLFLLLGSAGYVFQATSSCERVNRSAQIVHSAIGSAAKLSEALKVDASGFWDAANYTSGVVQSGLVKFFEIPKEQCDPDVEGLFGARDTDVETLDWLRGEDPELYERLQNDSHEPR